MNRKLRWGIAAVLAALLVPAVANAAIAAIPGPVHLRVGSVLGAGQAVNLDIYATGDLYIDYAAFLNDNIVVIPAGAQFVATGTFSIYAYGSEPAAWPHGVLPAVRLDDSGRIEVAGDAVLFVTGPIASATFESGADMFLGDYSEVSAAPLPPSAVLMLAGLLALRRKNARTRAARAIPRASATPRRR